MIIAARGGIRLPRAEKGGKVLKGRSTAPLSQGS